VLDVDLGVQGLDNPSWVNLVGASRAEYARRVADAVGTVVVDLWPSDARPAYVAIQIWDRSTEPRDLSGPDAQDMTCTQLPGRADRWDCQGPSTWAWLKLRPAADPVQTDLIASQVLVGSNRGN